MMSRLIGENVKKMQIWTLKICDRDISKTIIKAKSFKIGQLIEDDE